MKLNFSFVGKGEEYRPQHATEDASGCDLRNSSGKDIVVLPHTSKMVPTGICVEIPKGYEGQLRSRSGLSCKKKLILLNGVGTIDADYRGEIGCVFFNLNPYPITIKSDERIAQLIIAPYERCCYVKKESLSDTDRGSGGFGSTGK